MAYISQSSLYVCKVPTNDSKIEQLTALRTIGFQIYLVGSLESYNRVMLMLQQFGIREVPTMPFIIHRRNGVYSIQQVIDSDVESPSQMSKVSVRPEYNEEYSMPPPSKSQYIEHGKQQLSNGMSITKPSEMIGKMNSGGMQSGMSNSGGMQGGMSNSGGMGMGMSNSGGMGTGKKMMTALPASMNVTFKTMESKPTDERFDTSKGFSKIQGSGNSFKIEQ